MRAFLTVLFLAALLTAGASASTIYAVGFCVSFANPAPNATLTGSGVCPTAGSLGMADPTGEFIVYDSDYSNGLASTVKIETDWTISGVTAAFTTDTTTSTGGSTSNPAVSSDGLTLNPLTNLPPIVLAGFYDTVTGVGTPTISFTNKADTGTALESTGYAEVVYFTNTSPVPEPAAIPAAAAGFLALVLYRRKKTLSI